MHKVFIIYNLFFFLIGNILFSNIHHSNCCPYDVSKTNSHQDKECVECISTNNSDNCTLMDEKKYFLNDYITLPLFRYYNDIKHNISSKDLSRAPPISK